MAKKKTEKKAAVAEVERLEVEGGVIIKFEDGTLQFIPNPIKLTAEQVSSFFGSDDDDSDEDDDDDFDEELTGEDLADMDFEELEDVCDDHELETDPDDFDEDDVEKLRKAIAKEMGISLPKANKGKKGKKK